MKAPVTTSIAFFMHDLSGGGVERMRLRLAAGLVARGYNVTLIVQATQGELRNKVPPELELIDLRSRRSYLAVRQLVAVLRRCRPDILISSLDHNNLTAICAGILTRGRTRVVICQHNTLSEEAQTSWRYWIVPKLYWLLLPWADAILAVSHGVADDLTATAGLPRERVTVIHNPIVDHPMPARNNDPPHKWFRDQSVPVFLFVGRLVEQKNAEFLLCSMFVRLRQGPARLILLGDGSQLNLLRNEAKRLGISDNVHFAGFIDNPDDWMRYAAALVVPSRYEGFGNVIVEAMACGTPVIATDCPHGPREILAGGRFGVLVPLGDVNALAAAMGDNLRASFPPDRLIARAQTYSVATCLDRHELLFERVMRRHTGQTAFGLTLSQLPASEVCERMMHDVPHGAVRLIVTPNLYHLRVMRGNPAFAVACRSADIICPDGFPLAAYARLRGLTGHGRVTGCEIFRLLTELIALQKKRILVVTESSSTEAALRTWAAARGESDCWLSVVAPDDLLADANGQSDILDFINNARPDIVVMTIGAPASELFVHQNRSRFPACWVLCCGQAVRVELGLTRRTPSWFRRVNLEWAWRLMQEPRRLGPRYLRDVMCLPGLFWDDLFHAYRSEKYITDMNQY